MTVVRLNNGAVILSFLTLVVACCFYPIDSLLLYLPLLFLLLVDSSARGNTLADRFASSLRPLILPFVIVATVRFVREIISMKTLLSRPNPSLLVFILTNRRVRRIRDVLLYSACLPSYYSAFSISRGFFSLSASYVIVFGLLCFMGLFGEETSLRLFAAVGILLSLLQYVYIRVKERESLKYI